MKKLIPALVLILLSYSSNAQTWEIGSTTLNEYDLVTGIEVPWEILWGPDDYIWATERRGQVLHINPETGNYEVVLDLTDEIPNDGEGEAGMLGMAMHPDWDVSPLVYIVYNYGSGWNVSERLSTFEWNGSTLINENILIDDIPGGGIHNGSRLLISPDGYIYMTTGDTGSSGLSQDLGSINGKTLRINLDGSIPDGNPYDDSYVWSYGHRNAQGLCNGPNGLIYSSEHGQNNSDEFNIIEMDRNYGWPDVEGACNTSAEMTYCSENNIKEPLTEWSPCIAVNGIEYYNHPAIPEWDNCVLMSVLGGLSGIYERLSVLHMSDDGLTVESEDQYFSEFNQRVRDICVNPYTGTLYMALNGPGYPGSGPNIIKEFVNEDFASSVEWKGNLDQMVTLFPNPASSNLQLNFSSNFVGAIASVYSFQGQEVSSFSVSNELNQNLDVSDLAAGKYFIRISSDLGTVTKTFIVE